MLVAKVHEQCIIFGEGVTLCIQLQLWRHTAAAAAVCSSGLVVVVVVGEATWPLVVAGVLLFLGTWPCLRRISDIVVPTSCS